MFASSTESSFADNVGSLQTRPANKFKFEFRESRRSESDDSKWNYFREDSLLHEFHVSYHKVLNEKKKRSRELFQYGHQQILRRFKAKETFKGNFIYYSYSHPTCCFRAALERRVLGLPEFEPLDPGRMERPLGPAYGFGGIIGKDDIGDIAGRVEDCDLSKDTCQMPGHPVHPSLDWTDDCNKAHKLFEGQEWIKEMKKQHQNLMEDMTSGMGFEQFGGSLAVGYHGFGHNRIGAVCSSKRHEGIIGAMLPSETSARDPIFYRWHLHIEELFEMYKDKTQGSYTRSDFTLSDELKVLEVKTTTNMYREFCPTDFCPGKWSEVVNTLVTYEENETKGMPRLTYNKIGHHDYKYQIKMSNPQRSTKKVIVRIWLALGSSFYICNSFCFTF